MGVFEAIRKSPARTKAEVKAAEVHARQLAKQEAKADQRTAKLLDKAEKRLLKEEKKGLKRKQKHEKDLAKAHLKRIEESGITKKKAKQATGAARVLVPILLPLAYKGLTSLQQQRVNSRAAGLGLSSQDLARHSGRGAELKARIDAARENVEHSDSLSEGFKNDARVRLDELEQAVRNAEVASPEQRRLALKSVEDDLAELTAEVQAKLRR